MKNMPGNIIDIINDPFGFTFNELANIIGEHEAASLFSLLYKNTAQRKAHTIWIKDILKDNDTRKYLFESADNNYIETVCIKRRTGITACVSTQVGCPVRCVFCESGRNGLTRNLTVSEIVQQILFLKEPVNRIVFMGIGEPLYNYDSLIQSIHILRDRNGLNFPTGGITVSTVGPLKLLKRLREEHIKIQLVLSLHATTQKTRDYIIPGMAGNPINQTVEAALSYSRRHNRKLIIAYLVLPGINDTPSDIHKLAEWFKHANVLINLLQYNRTNRNTFKTANKDGIERFQDILEKYGLEVNIRESHGKNIKAACGQLAGKYGYR